MSELPDSWVTAPLGELLSTIVGGGTPSKANPDYFRGSIPFMTVKDMHGRFIADTQDHITEQALESSASALIPADTLVVASRMSLGKVARPQIPVAINQDLKALFLHEGVDKTYVEYAWRSKESEIQAMGTGTTVKGIRLEDIRGLEIPVAPSAEQTRIADQLDKLLARIQSCNDRLDAIPALLKRFRQAVLTAATTGDLSQDWRKSNPSAVGEAAKEVKQRLSARRAGHEGKTKFKEPIQPDLRYWHLDVPASWSVESVSAFAECLDHRRIPVTKENRATSERLYPYFGANGQVDMVDGYLFDDDLVLVTEDETFYGRVKPIAYRFSGRCWVNNHAHVLLAGDRIRADYLCFSLMHYDVFPWLTGTTGRAKLTQGSLNALPLAVPPQSEMDEIVRRVEAMFKLADRIEARYTAARTQAQRLTPLLLAKAFRGELVQQDPQDEPASLLLERIAAAPPVKARASRGRPRVKPERQLALPELKPADWASLPDGAWAAPANPDGHATMVWVVAVLRTSGRPVPEREARLTALFCLQPRLFTPLLPVAEAKQWSRLVGDEASPLPTQVRSFQPAINGHWGRAIKGMRARGDLVETGTGSDITWALGAGAASIETAGWPDGRAGFVVAYLRAHGTDSVLPLLETSAQEFADARAA